MQLCVGPAYHAAPLGIDIRVPHEPGRAGRIHGRALGLRGGAAAPSRQHRVTHGHMVAIMFQRLLRAAAGGAGEVRPLQPARRSSTAPRRLPARREAGDDRVGRPDPQRILRRLAKAAAASPSSSEEWLKKPGSVGKLRRRTRTRVLDERRQRGRSSASRACSISRSPPPTRSSTSTTRRRPAASHRDGYFTARRRRLFRRGRLPLPHRPHRRVHHLRRGEHLSAGDRQRADQAPGGRGRPARSACPTTSGARR